MEYPTSFKSDLVQKALGKGFEDFVEKYHGAKDRMGFKEPTDWQREVADIARKKGFKAARLKYPKESYHRVKHAIDKVARYEWLNN